MINAVKLTILFSNPFWIGVFERYEGSQYRACKVTFGAEPKEAEVFDYYTPVIIASEKMISEEKELVQSFMSAVEKGYKYCIEKPAEAAAILLENVLAGKYQEDAQYWGRQKEEVWERYMTWLYENGFIENAIDVTKAFTNDFLNK